MSDLALQLTDRIVHEFGIRRLRRHYGVRVATRLGANVTITGSALHPAQQPKRLHAFPPLPRETNRVSIGGDLFIRTAVINLIGCRLGHVLPESAVAAAHAARSHAPLPTE